jgi:hypothetical protein
MFFLIQMICLGILFIIIPQKGWAADNFSLEQCRSRLKKIVCPVDQFPENGYIGGPVGCRQPNEPYARKLESLLIAYPLPIQRLFCSLKVIFISKDLENAAMGGAVF